MTNEDLKREIVKDLRSYQIKYIYYVIALNVAAVAFTVGQAKDQSYNITHLYLGGSIFCWSIGVFCGFNFLFRFQKVIHISYNFLELFDELIARMSEEEINTKVKSKIDAKSEQIQVVANIYYKFALFSFYIGCLLFIVWQAIQMIYFNHIQK